VSGCFSINDEVDTSNGTSISDNKLSSGEHTLKAQVDLLSNSGLAPYFVPITIKFTI
jgi:hypothetical protein